MRFHPRLIRITFCALVLPVLGCGFLERSEAKRTAAREAVEAKKKNYQELHNTLMSGSLKVGTSADEIRELFGEPDDVFQSSTMTSHFEIWSYEKILEQGEKDRNPIRLYFENGKVISWNY